MNKNAVKKDVIRLMNYPSINRRVQHRGIKAQGYLANVFISHFHHYKIFSSSNLIS